MNGLATLEATGVEVGVAGVDISFVNLALLMRLGFGPAGAPTWVSLTREVESVGAATGLFGKNENAVLSCLKSLNC